MSENNKLKELKKTLENESSNHEKIYSIISGIMGDDSTSRNKKKDIFEKYVLPFRGIHLGATKIIYKVYIKDLFDYDINEDEINELREQIREMEAEENIPNIDLKKAKSDFSNYTEKQRKYEEIIALKPSNSMNCRNKTDAIDSLKKSAENGHPEAMLIFAKKVLNDEILVKFKPKNEIIKEISFDTDESLDFNDRRIFSLDNTTGKTNNSNDIKKRIVDNFLEPLVREEKLEESNSEALFIRYNILDKGLYGFDSDKKKALDFLKMSGTLKHSEALIELNNYTKRLFPELDLGEKLFSETNKNFEKEPIEETIEIFKVLAKTGDKNSVEALYHIGILIYRKKLKNDGTVLFSNDELMEILRFLIDLDYTRAMYEYGKIIFLGDCNQQKNVVAGFEFIKNAAEKNDCAAQYYCGCILLSRNFNEIGQNVELGLEFLEKSANNGYAKAMFKLACIFNNGDIVERDADKSNYYLDEAVSKGHKKAIEVKKIIENKYLENKNCEKQSLFTELIAKSSEFCDKNTEYHNSGLKNEKTEEYLKQLECEAINLLNKLYKSNLIENLDDRKNVTKTIALIDYSFLIYNALNKYSTEWSHYVLFDELIKKNKIYLDNDILNLVIEKAKSDHNLDILYSSIIIIMNYKNNNKNIYFLDIKEDEEKLLEISNFYLSDTSKKEQKDSFDESIIGILNTIKFKKDCSVEKRSRINNIIDNYRKRKLTNATAKFEERKEHNLI